MTTEDESSATPSAPPTPPQQPRQTAFEPTWQLPPGIENHIEALLLKSAIGIAVGAPIGFLAFRSGRGANAAAGMAFGVGCALGSFIERGIIGGSGGENVDPALPRFDFGWLDGMTGKHGSGGQKE
ncbi:hypothetical protein HJC23_001046 [Cyclotella cryptica]|uniref:NADH-ubiquinone oxidoreductase 21kDa subunit N-terminal domain-containing protein n=1 Tax=Cyclotella cryptica TaxID=29204 RepID=A0ABD3QIB8_9STRA